MLSLLAQHKRPSRHVATRIFFWVLSVVGFLLLCLTLVLAGFRWQAERREVQTATVAAPATGRFVQAADVQMFIQEMGSATGPAVLFVHGTGAWSETWRESMTALAQEGFHAIAIDLPPFGYSGKPFNKRYGRQDQAARIIGVLDALKIPRATLVGHSFGGGPTVEAAFFAPERVRALVLVDVALDLAAADSVKEPSSGLPQQMLTVRPLRDAVVATFLTNPLFTKHLLGLFIADPVHATPDRVKVYQQPLTLTGSTQAIGEWLPVLFVGDPSATSSIPASYKSLKMPAVIVWGEHDTITPLSQGQQLASIMPGAELLVMPQIGHIPQIEDTPQFTALLQKIFAKLKDLP